MAEPDWPCFPAHVTSVDPHVWQDFESHLQLVEPGTVVFTQWEEWRMGDDFDPESLVEAERAQLLAKLVPTFVTQLAAMAEDELSDFDPDETAPATRLLARLNSPVAERATGVAMVSSIGWEVWGWVGEIQIWTLRGAWVTIAAWYESLAWGYHLPVVLGFARAEAMPTAAARVVRATIGQYVGTPNQVTSSGLEPADASTIVAGLGAPP